MHIENIYNNMISDINTIKLATYSIKRKQLFFFLKIMIVDDILISGDNLENRK